MAAMLALNVCLLRNRELRHLRACGQPHAASLQAVGPNVSFQCALQVVGPYVLGFAVWAATRGFFASCRSGCPGSRGAVWAATRGFIASCRSACLSPSSCMSTWLGRAALNLHGCNCIGTLCICMLVSLAGGEGCTAGQSSSRVRKPGVSTPHWFGDSPPSTAICWKPSVRRTGTGRGVGELTGPIHQHGARQPCVCVVIMFVC